VLRTTLRLDAYPETLGSYTTWPSSEGLVVIQETQAAVSVILIAKAEHRLSKTAGTADRVRCKGTRLFEQLRL
jgi:hypothetical protein